MTNAVFTTSESSAYDDQIEVRYHFPGRYLRQVEQTVGDFIVYYEPRRTTGPHSHTGRMAYFATAQVVNIVPDNILPDHHYARLVNFLEFDEPVPFRNGGICYESILTKNDGSTNKGAFGRSVRLLAPEQFAAIVSAGLSNQPDAWEVDPSDVDIRPAITQLTSRKFRDAAFRRHVRNAYSNTCAVSGLRLMNGGGRPEVQAAHIRPVGANGPDTVRNGIALTGTVHWLFDRGLIAFEDNYEILLSPQGLPDNLHQLVPKERKLLLPRDLSLRPHATYLAWHRMNIFKT